MLTVLFILILVSTLSIFITVVIWLYFNKENPKSIEMFMIARSMSEDLGKIGKGLKLLVKVTSEVAKPILNSEVVDVKSEDLSDDVKAK